MASVFFDPQAGGDGSTVTDDADPNTGLRRGGYQTRFVPALQNTVNTSKTAVQKAVEALASQQAAALSETNASNFATQAGTSANSASASATSALASAQSASASAIDAANSASEAVAIALGQATGRPTIRPSLNLDFVNQQVVDRRIVVNRNSPKTYFGKEKVLGDENFLRYSEAFENATWVKANVTTSTNNEIAPDGTLTAETLTETTANANHAFAQTVSFIDSELFGSFFIKKGNGSTAPDYVQLYARNGPVIGFANFDLVNGVVTLTEQLVSAGIEPAANGFYRCWIRYKPDATDSHTRFAFINNNPLENGIAKGVLISYTGQTTSDVIVWGAQLEEAREGQTKPTAYVRTDAYPVRTFFNKLQTAPANTMPVEFDPVTQECLGIKPESQQTNLFINSEDYNLEYGKTNALVESSVKVAPDGKISGDRFETTTTVSYLSKSNIPLTVGQTYIFSFYAKAGSAKWISFRVIAGFGGLDYYYFDLVNGVTGATANQTRHKIEDVGGGWYRCSYIDVATSSLGAIRYYLANGDEDPTAIGDAYLWGAQLEQSTLGSPSSYIPTQNAQVTRLADDLSMPVSAFEYNQNEGSVYIDSTSTNGNTYYYTLTSDTSGANYLAVNQSTAVAINYLSLNQGAGQANFNQSLSAGTDFRSVFSFSENNVFAAVNGTLSAVDTVAFNPSNIQQLFIGMQFNKGRVLNNYIRALRYYPKALSALEAQSLSQV